MLNSHPYRRYRETARLKLIKRFESATLDPPKTKATGSTFSFSYALIALLRPIQRPGRQITRFPRARKHNTPKHTSGAAGVRQASYRITPFLKTCTEPPGSCSCSFGRSILPTTIHLVVHL